MTGPRVKRLDNELREEVGTLDDECANTQLPICVRPARSLEGMEVMR